MYLPWTLAEPLLTDFVMWASDLLQQLLRSQKCYLDCYVITKVDKYFFLCIAVLKFLG